MHVFTPARAIAIAAVASAFAFIPTSAAAATFCVGASEACAPGTEQPMTSAGLQTALTNASTLPGEDTIQIAAGTVELTTVVATTPGVANPVHIVGAGKDQTTLHMAPAAGGTIISLNFGNVPTSSLQNLSVTIDGVTSAGRTAVDMTHGLISDVDFNMTSNSGYGTTGLHASTGVTCNSCSFNLSGSGAQGVYVNDANSFDQATFTGLDPIGVNSTTGISMSGSGPTTISRSVFKNLSYATSQDSGVINLVDTLIDLRARPSAYGVFVDNQNNGVSSLTGTLDGVTIVGSGDSQTAFLVAGESPSTENGHGTIVNSLLHLTGTGAHELVCKQSGTGTAALAVSYSMLTSLTPTVVGVCSPSITNVSTASPTFIDAANSDYRPAPGSAVIDAGDPAAVQGRSLDLIGGARFKNGVSPYATGGTIDYGAIEYQNYRPSSPLVTAAPATVKVGEPVTFGASSTDDNGDALTYSWNFDDDSALGDGATTTHAFALPGTYQPKAFAGDGLTTSSGTTTVTVLAADPLLAILPPAPTPTLTLKKSPIGFKLGKRGFALTDAKSKAKLTLTSSSATTVKLTLARSKGGFVSGKKCVKHAPASGKIKRCDLPLPGAQKLPVKTGVSYVTFGGKLGNKMLPAGKYVVTVTSTDSKDAPKSVLNLIR
jgi:hypothetical protein